MSAEAWTDEKAEALFKQQLKASTIIAAFRIVQAVCLLSEIAELASTDPTAALARYQSVADQLEPELVWINEAVLAQIHQHLRASGARH